MRRGGRTFLLASGVLIALIALLSLGWCAATWSPTIYQGEATEADMKAAIDEFTHRMDRLDSEVREFIRGLCKTYPELKDTEECRAATGH